MSVIVHSYYVNVMLTLLLQCSSKGEDTTIFNEVLVALLIAGVSSSLCCGTAELPKRWYLALGLHVEADVAESQIIDCWNLAFSLASFE